MTDGGLQGDMLVEVSAPGLYEINFDRVTADRSHPIEPRRVDVHCSMSAPRLSRIVSA